MNTQTESDLVRDASDAARYSHWAVRSVMAGIPVFGIIIGMVWWMSQRASAEATAPVSERMAAAEARIGAVEAAQASMALSSESITADAWAIRVMVESRVTRLESHHHGSAEPKEGQ